MHRPGAVFAAGRNAGLAAVEQIKGRVHGIADLALGGGRHRVAVVEGRFDDVFELGEIGGAHLNSLNFVV